MEYDPLQTILPFSYVRSRKRKKVVDMADENGDIDVVWTDGGCLVSYKAYKTDATSVDDTETVTLRFFTMKNQANNYTAAYKRCFYVARFSIFICRICRNNGDPC